MSKDIPLEQEEALTCKEVFLEQEGLLGNEASLEQGEKIMCKKNFSEQEETLNV
jgi:hypothetical protein